MYEDRGEILRRAAERTLEMTGWLKQRMQPAEHPLLETMARHFLDPGYTVARLKKALKLRSHWFITSLAKVVDLTPWRLIREWRLETLARLLRDTSLSLVEIILLVGYQSERATARLLRLWCGMGPRVYRAHSRRVKKRLKAPPEETFSWLRFERLCSGELDVEEGEEIIEALEEMRPLEPGP